MELAVEFDGCSSYGNTSCTLALCRAKSGLQQSRNCALVYKLSARATRKRETSASH